MTNRPRLWFTVFVLLVFLAGTAAGVLVGHLVEPALFAGPEERPPFRRLPGRERSPEGPIQRMTQDLDLSEEQQQQLSAIFERRRGRLAQFQQQVRARFDEEHESLRAEIEKILTPTQRERFAEELRKRPPRPLPPLR